VRVLASQLILPIYQVRLPRRWTLSCLRLFFDEHELIAAALLAGDWITAEQVMRQHIGNAGEGLIRTLAALEPPPRPSRTRRAPAPSG
jgi:DNA-binding GntR family transcriptional regulator